MDWALNHFVFDRKEIKYILGEHQSIGAHTDIYQFQAGGVKIYRWTHPIRPFGTSTNRQCAGCSRLGTLRPNVTPTEILLKCNKCKDENRYTFPAGWEWIDGPMSKSDKGGAWIVYK